MIPCKDNDITELEEDQEFLVDRSGSGRERPWSEKKLKNQKLIEIYRYLDNDKADRLSDCASILNFAVLPNGKKRLEKANFCRVRLCPICQWRRSLKVYSQMTNVFAALGGKYAVVCANFTVKNCGKDELSKTIDLMMGAFNRMTKYKPFDVAVKGYYRAMEITHNLDKDSKSYDTFHPHFHCLFVVNKSYFVDKTYISHEKWIDLWKKALKVDYRPDIKVYKLTLSVGQDITAALCEVTKYTVKDSDYITEDMDFDVETVACLDQALNKRRFVSLGGLLKDLHKKLNLSEIEDDQDLIHVDGDNITVLEPVKQIYYVWHSGYQQYRKW